ncbi:MAG: ATP-binding protein, partial [Myxococcota bacterium]
DRHQRNLGTVLRNARNLLRLINDLLDISQMEAGKITLVLKAFDLTELIEEVVEMLQPLAAAKKLKLTARAEAGGGGPRMFSDRMRCKQILINLVNNAIKFTDTGGVEVTLELLADEEQVAIHVRDSGIGIRSADLKVIFEKFRQLDGSASRKYGGAGLGLAISIQLCRLLGGDISAASVPGEGSTFTLTLPLQVHPNAPEPMERGPEGELLPESPRSVEGDQGDPEAWPDEDGRPFILLMDDDPLALVNLREGVRDAGLEVKSAFTAKEAADILSTLDPVAVVIGAAMLHEVGRDDGGAHAFVEFVVAGGVEDGAVGPQEGLDDALLLEIFRLVALERPAEGRFKGGHLVAVGAKHRVAVVLHDGIDRDL